MLIFFLLISRISGFGETVKAIDCSQEEVALAISRAKDGDVVQIPAGTAVWTGGIVIPSSKRLSIFGAGMGKTILTKKNRGSALAFNSSSRVAGITFSIGGEANVRGIDADGLNWRIHHCRFESDKLDAGVLVTGLVDGRHPTGLIDHCEFENCQPVIFGWGNLKADKIWNQPNGLGTKNAVYVEDCYMKWTIFGNAIDANYGGKYVIRYCTIIDSSIEAHSLQGPARAAKSWEIYENTIIQSNMLQNVPFFLRGGTGVVFSNTIVGKWNRPVIAFDNVRSAEVRGITGTADGGSLWDGNDPIVGGTGSHNGPLGSVLRDTNRQWTPGEFVAPLATNRWVYNLTDGSSGRITANTANTITAELSGGIANQWRPGDLYKITGGYPARDQIGRGPDLNLWTDLNPFPRQSSEPAYIWGNKLGDKSLEVYIGNGQQNQFHIKEGRDYFVGIRKPGYEPLTYPHPLIFEERPTKPKNADTIPSSKTEN